MSENSRTSKRAKRRLLAFKLKLLPHIQKLPKSSNFELRYRLIQLLGKIGITHPKILSFIIQSTKDPYWRIRYLSVELLKNQDLPSKRILPILRRTLQDKRWEIRSNVASSFGEFGVLAKNDLTNLIRYSKDKNWHVRANIIRSLGKIAPYSKIVQTIAITALKDSKWNVRYHAIITLTKAKKRTILAEKRILRAFFQTFQKEKRWSVKMKLLKSLKKFRWTEEIRKIILLALKEKDESLHDKTLKVVAHFNQKMQMITEYLLEKLSKKKLRDTNLHILAKLLKKSLLRQFRVRENIILWKEGLLIHQTKNYLKKGEYGVIMRRYQTKNRLYRVIQKFNVRCNSRENQLISLGKTIIHIRKNRYQIAEKTSCFFILSRREKRYYLAKLDKIYQVRLSNSRNGWVKGKWIEIFW